MPDASWYAQTPEHALQHFQSSPQGLRADQIETQRRTYGSNTLPEKRPDGLLKIFLRQFQSPLIFILAGACVLILFIREYADAVIIFSVLLFNAVVGTIQEGKAQNTLASLKRLVETKATVLRDGREEIIPDTEVVAGDVLLLREGDKIPADARVISSTSLTVDEASLTGESQPVYKTSEAFPAPGLSTAEQKNMLFKATHIVAGSGSAVVVATGIATVIGAISKKIATIESEDPVKRDVRKLSSAIIVAVTIICSALFVGGLLAGNSVREMFTTVVSLSVSIIPEGLPIVLTLVLATGVWRMSKKNALVKKLQAVESLGQASIIAVDKTGTITKNELTVTRIHVDGRMFTITGSGYEPRGEALLDGEPVSAQETGLLYMARISAFCANAHVAFSQEKQIWQVSGDPTEAALLVFSEKLGLAKVDLEKEAPQLAEIPFSYRTKYHAVLHADGSQGVLTAVGAPEAIMKACVSTWQEGKNVDFGADRITEIEGAVERMSKEGLRVLGVATRVLPQHSLAMEDVKDLTFVGLVGMKDVLREEVAPALAKAREAGVKVVMITGDHRITARAIAEEAGIFVPGDSVLTGVEIEEMNAESLAKAVENVSVFARVTPEHKLRIIQAYQARGEIIAMTGDGVNDAPPLVAADLGVAMGKIGTEVAKEAADIVLLDDNFGSIVSAMEEGRNIYKTIKKVILYLFSTSLGEVLVITGSIVLGFPLPVLASQIIWLNFVTDGFLDVSLAMEPKEKGLLKEPRATTSFVDALMAKRMLLMAIPMSIGSLWMFSRHMHVDLVKAQTITLTTLAAFQWFNAWNCRSEKRSIFKIGLWSNPYVLGATVLVILLQLLAVYHPFMQKFLRTTALDIGEWILIILTASSITVVEEVRKWFYRRKERRAV